jgi:O-antigen biosynthesis protein
MNSASKDLENCQFPSVVVGVPAYNEERFIGEALSSLQSQTFKTFNVVVSINASTDATAEISYGVARSDSRFAVHQHTQNIGSAGNFEWVFRNTSSDLFIWLGAHDKLAPDFLEEAVKLFGANPQAALCFSDTLMIAEDGSDIGCKDGGSYHLVDGSSAQRYRRTFTRIGPCEAINNLFRRSALEGITFPQVASLDRMIICWASFHGKFVKIEKPLYIRRQLENRQKGSQARLVRLTGKARAKVNRWATIIEFQRQYARLDISLAGRIAFACRLYSRFSRYILKDLLKMIGLKKDAK